MEGFEYKESFITKLEEAIVSEKQKQTEISKKKVFNNMKRGNNNDLIPW